MRILVLLLVGLFLSNCSNSYVKNKKTITSPDDLMKFTNIWCEKQKQTNNVIKMCGQGWSKDLNISESKAIIDAKLKIADITQHSIIKSENIVKKENSKISKLIGVNRAARCTTVKPAGTTSLTLGTSSGIHAWHNDYYIRRLRVGKNESIYSYLAKNHPQLIEDDYFRPMTQL